MDTTFRTALRQVCTGELTAALITVTRVKGSTPRKPGAKMLLLPDGQTFGTIGGGCGEAEVRSQALMALDRQTSCTYWVNMTNDTAEDEGMVCGGVMEVLIDVLLSGSTPEKDFLIAYLDDLDNGYDPVLFTVIQSPGSPVPGQKFFFSRKGEKAQGQAENSIIEALRTQAKGVCPGGKTFTVTLEELGTTILVEPAPAPVQLLILGGGHIALPLATMAKILGYAVWVVDDRPSFANSGRFPEVDEVICDDFGKALDKIDIGPNHFVVIVTRGHKHDRICLSRVISSPAAYIGMIGSRRRVKALLADLENEGVAKEILHRVYTPIGLDIGAETPEEIAVSILAELIAVNRSGNVRSLKLMQD